MNTYVVEIQPSTGYELKNETFTVKVDAPDGFDQAARRGVRRAVDRAAEWNAEHPEAITPRLANKDAYRVVGVRAPADERVPATAAAAPAGATAATLIVALPLEAVLAQLNP
ncbi:hypothetical protein ABIC28_005165 [Rhodococcus sp. PvR044]|uniref:hypothetical protein n=1 Tax=Rhodococcus sp. PvR044 TaxID=3156402 RepID=UPI003394B42E